MYSFQSDHLHFFITLSIHHKTKTTRCDFTKRQIGHHLNNMLRISSVLEPKPEMFMRQINTLSRQLQMPTDLLSLKKITTAQMTFRLSMHSGGYWVRRMRQLPRAPSKIAYTVSFRCRCF